MTTNRLTWICLLPEEGLHIIFPQSKGPNEKLLKEKQSFSLRAQNLRTCDSGSERESRMQW